MKTIKKELNKINFNDILNLDNETHIQKFTWLLNNYLKDKNFLLNYKISNKIKNSKNLIKQNIKKEKIITLFDGVWIWEIISFDIDVYYHIDDDYKKLRYLKINNIMISYLFSEEWLFEKTISLENEKIYKINDLNELIWILILEISKLIYEWFNENEIKMFSEFIKNVEYWFKLVYWFLLNVLSINELWKEIIIKTQKMLISYFSIISLIEILKKKLNKEIIDNKESLFFYK